MDYKKLAASLIIPRLNLIEYQTDLVYKQEILSLINFGVRGFCIFGKIDSKSLITIINELNKIAQKKLIFSADFEYGLPMRLMDGTAFPHAMALGKTGDIQKTFIASQIIAKESKALGVDWVFGPVSDINSNKNNPIINIRSFGENPEIVSNHSVAYIKGLHQFGVVSTAKHFPGHGDTEVDSHLDLPFINKSKSDLLQFELLPFIKAIENDVKSIMIGHLALPLIDSTGIPASLSIVMIKDLLINELGYKGIILTDALEMKAIANKLNSSLAVEMCLRAGNDIALMPENPLEAINHLENIIQNDKVFLNQLENSIEKIDSIDKWILQNDKNVKYDKDEFLQHEKIALSIAQSALELKANLILTPIEEKQIAAFAFVPNERAFEQASMFFNLMQQAFEEDLDFAFVNEEIEESDLIGLASGIEDAEIIIFANFYRSEAYQKNIGKVEEIKRIQKTLAKGKNIINIYFGNPYLDEFLISDTSIFAYSDSLCSLAAVIMLLSGRKLD